MAGARDRGDGTVMTKPDNAASPALASGLLLALIGAIAFSGKAIIVKLAYRHGVDAITLIMYRMVPAGRGTSPNGLSQSRSSFGGGRCPRWRHRHLGPDDGPTSE